MLADLITEPERATAGRSGGRCFNPRGETSTVSTMSEPLAMRLTVVYEEIEDGWVMATIPEFPAAMSQGRNRQEARENVRDALRELLLSYADEGQVPSPAAGSEQEPLELLIAP